jgi:hypothetical protein
LPLLLFFRHVRDEKAEASCRENLLPGIVLSLLPNGAGAKSPPASDLIGAVAVQHGPRRGDKLVPFTRPFSGELARPV